MKKKLLLFIMLTCPLLAVAQYSDKEEEAVVEINATNFPDETFRNFLLSQSFGSDGQLTTSEIENIWSLSLPSSYSSAAAISSLKGIEYFTALTSLSCYNNQLTTLDISKNTALTELWCDNNPLTTLDISENTALTSLYCNNNQLTTLDISKNTALTRLSCGENQLTALDVSKNTALTRLTCGENQLTTLDVSENTALTSLYCGGNQLTALDVSKNTALERLACGANQLTALDLSENAALTWLSCYDNHLTALDVSENTLLTCLIFYQNQIKGTAMDNLINSLCYDPYHAPTFRVFSTYADEGNVCTASQVAAVKAKGWIPQYFDAENIKWEFYDGNDPSGIHGVLKDEYDTNDPVYNLSGQRLTALKKGINIIGGKKVVVK